MLVMSFSNVFAIPLFNSSATKYVSNASEYTYQRNFGFQTNIYNDTAALDIQNVTFELTRVEGTATNYTKFTAIALTNTSNGITYYVNFTQEQLGRAKNTTNCYSYIWYAKTTSTSEENSTSSSQWCLNTSTATGTYMNLTRRSYPTGTIYQDYETGADLSYSSATSQNITGFYDSRFTGQSITFTLYQGQASIGTSNPQSSTRDFTDQTETWTYNTSGNVNYTTASKDIAFAYQGASSGGGGSGGVSTTLPNCPFECCSPGEDYIEKMCSSGNCVNHACSLGATTTIYSGGYTPQIGGLTDVYYGLPLYAWLIIGLFILVILIFSFYYALK